jgi:hypothetical protein
LATSIDAAATKDSLEAEIGILAEIKYEMEIKILTR